MAKKHRRNTKGLIPFVKGQSGNPNGRPKGTKSLSTIILELENEEFDWKLFPKQSRELKEFIDQAGPIGSPFRAIVYRALLDSVSGRGVEKIAAREWLRKAGYGDKIDLTSKGQRIKQEPVILSTIFKRDVETQTETAESN